MGVDAADINNDGRPICSWPTCCRSVKTSSRRRRARRATTCSISGFAPAITRSTRNTLQLNRGDATFAEIGYLAGVFATDWSWAPLFADLDNDVLKDLFITSGIYRRPNDLDYINYVGNEAVQASLAKGITKENLPLLDRMPRIPLANHAYHNNGDLTFTNKADASGLAEPGFSNGAAYVDLNNSGSLDIVVNRINAPAAIYRNHARTVNGNGYLTVELRGARGNTSGIGAHVTVKQQGTMQVLEQGLTRGFSPPSTRGCTGLGSAKQVDSLIVLWPDRRTQVLTNVATNRLITLWQDSAAWE